MKDLDVILNEEIERLKEKGLYRTLRVMEYIRGPVARIDGKEFIIFSSNDYLGLAGHPEMIKSSVEATKRFGTGTGSSRLLSGTMELTRILENSLAEFKGCEETIVFSTGYMANLGVITSLAGRGDVVIIDKLNHASIIDGCKLSGARLRIYPHKDMGRLEALLASSMNFRRRLIITDGVFSMDGDIAPLEEITGLAEKYEAVVIVDDAHGTGVLGKTGRGVLEHLGMKSDGIIQMGTFSKALGSLGGYIAGHYPLIDLLRNKARAFIYTTAPTPSILAASIASIELIEREPEHRNQLWKNTETFRAGLKDLGFNTMESTTPIIPIFIGDEEKTMRLSNELYEEGIYAPGIRPPTVPHGMGRVRFSVTALHTEDHLQKAHEALEKVGRRIGIV